MRKTLLTLFCAFTTLMLSAQSAKTYSDNLVVTVNDLSTPPIPADVLVIDNGDGTINFALKNFCLVLGDNSMPVGNIAIDNLKLEDTEDGLKAFTYNGPLTIAEGDMEGVDSWMGPLLGELPLELSGKLSDDKLYVAISLNLIDMLGQVIYVQFGTDDFETSISKINVNSSLQQVYDISGRPVIQMGTKNLPKGLYVIKGKKISVK
ncbi:MAG: calycin-like domain-containing protein [Bacteroidaceae bacterium]|nr:calycin-like domain-containing protein [Bacteroidaceae bacterium]